jgi:hypothetical protein
LPWVVAVKEADLLVVLALQVAVAAVVHTGEIIIQ